MRGEGFSYYLWCLDTLNIFLGVLPIFSERAYLRPFSLVGCQYYNIFLGRCSIFSDSMYLFGSFSLYFSFLSLSLSLIYFTLLLVLFANASETNRCSFTEFLLQQRGKGRVCTRSRGEGVVNCREINNKNEAKDLTTLLQRLKYWLKR